MCKVGQLLSPWLLTASREPFLWYTHPFSYLGILNSTTSISFVVSSLVLQPPACKALLVSLFFCALFVQSCWESTVRNSPTHPSPTTPPAEIFFNSPLLPFHLFVGPRSWNSSTWALPPTGWKSEDTPYHSASITWMCLCMHIGFCPMGIPLHCSMYLLMLAPVR